MRGAFQQFYYLVFFLNFSLALTSAPLPSFADPHSGTPLDTPTPPSCSETLSGSAPVQVFWEPTDPIDMEIRDALRLDRFFDHGLYYELRIRGNGGEEAMIAAQLAKYKIIDGQAFLETVHVSHEMCDRGFLDRLIFAYRALPFRYAGENPRRALSDAVVAAREGKILDTRILRWRALGEIQELTFGMDITQLSTPSLLLLRKWVSPNPDVMRAAERRAELAELVHLNLPTFLTLSAARVPNRLHLGSTETELPFTGMEDAEEIAEWVANDGLSYGQIIGFYARYANQEPGFGSIKLKTVARLIVAFNRGELMRDDLDTLLNVETYYGSRLIRRIHGFMNRWPQGPELYTRPIFGTLTFELLVQLRDKDTRDRFIQEFRNSLERDLPRRFQFRRLRQWNRRDATPGWQLEKYINDALWAAKEAIGVTNIGSAAP